MNTYKEAIEYLNTFRNFEKSGFEEFKDSVSLSRIKAVLEKMGRPEEAYTSIHIAGTKGKGSVCTFVSSILTCSGYRTGLFTSPHLHDILERIKIDGAVIRPEVFTRAVAEIEAHINDSGENFTYFEILTLAAILIFKKEGVDHAVFETGLGGRLDATNVIGPGVTGITPVSFDHMDVLGEDIESIAREKAGIIKENSVCVMSLQSEKVERVIETESARRNSVLLKAGRDFTHNVIGQGPWGSDIDIETNVSVYRGCRIEMPGRFQQENAAQAVCICEQVLRKNISVDKVKQGLRRAFIPGRLEIISEDPLIVIDGAQNEESMKKLKYSVEQIFKYDRLILLLGISREKDISGISAVLKPMADIVILTKSASARAMDPRILRGYFKHKKALVTNDVKEALGIAFVQARKNDLILATGSFYMIGELRGLILKENPAGAAISERQRS